jgi:hypothetical protein
MSSKISLASPERATEFTVESGTALGKGDGLAARKLVVLSPNQLRQWGNEQEELLEEAAKAKYAACPEARTALRAVHNCGIS